MSTRFVPLSLEKPKALLKVRGEVLIERQIRQLQEAGVQEIIIVVGYLKEQFSYLMQKYGVILVENPVYQTRNNHSTLYVAGKYLKNTFVCSGDNYFAQNVFVEESAVYEEGKTDEWCLASDDNGRIKDVNIGGQDAWVMKGHAYFTKDFSDKLLPYLTEAYEEDDGRNKFWEDIYIEHLEEMEMYIHRYPKGVIEEFDSIEELREFECSYIECTGSRILEKVCKLLAYKESEITKIRQVKKQGQAIGFTFDCRKRGYSFLFRTEELKELEG